MKTRNLLLGLFFLLAILFASISLSEYLGAKHAETTNTTQASVSTSPVRFDYSFLPSQFFAGGYNVTVSQGTDYYITGNGTSYDYLGFYTTFGLTLGNQTQTVPFFWNTPSGASTAHPPYYGGCMAEYQSTTGCPYSARAFDGNVSIVWTEQDATIYVTFAFT